MFDVGKISMVAAAAIGRYLRFKVDSNGKAAVAVLADRAAGTTLEEAFAADQVIQVALNNKPGTAHGISAAAIAAGAELFSAAAGKVSSTAATGSFRVGKALHAVASADMVIEFIPQPGEVAQP